MLKMKDFLLLKNVAANPCGCLARNGETATASKMNGKRIKINILLPCSKR